MSTLPRVVVVVVLSLLPLVGGCASVDEPLSPMTTAPPAHTDGQDVVRQVFPSQGVISATPPDTVDFTVVAPSLPEQLMGDFVCLGQNLPAEPSGEQVERSGRVHVFQSTIVVPYAVVALHGPDGTLLAETVSDERAEFSIAFQDTKAFRDGYFEVFVEFAGDAYLTTRHSTTHPELTWADGLELSVANDLAVQIIQLATDFAVDGDLGVIHGELADCLGETEVAGARVEIDPPAGELFFTTTGYTFTQDLDETTATSDFYFVNVPAGEYVVTAFAEEKDGQRHVLNSVIYQVAEGGLSSQVIYPE